MTLRVSSLVKFVVLAVFLIYISGNLIAAQTPFESVPDAITIVALAFAPLAFFVRQPLADPDIRRFVGLYLVYLLLLLLSTLVNGNPYLPAWQSFPLDFLLDSKPFVFAFLLLAFLTDEQMEKFFQTLLLVIVGAGALNLLFILHDLFSTTNAYGIPLQQRSGLSIPTGFLNQKTKSAQLQLIAMIASLAMLRGSGYFAKRQLILGLTIVFGYSIAVHLSIKEIGSAGIVLILYNSLKPGRRIGRAALLGMALTALAAISLTFDSPIRSAAMNRIDIFLGERGSEVVRTVAYPASIDLANQHFPLGTGASTFMSKGARDLAYSPYYVQTGISRLHGGSRRDGAFLMDVFWPKILAQSGYFGFLAFLGLIFWPILKGLRRMQTEADGAIFASTGIMVSLAIASMAAPIYTDDHLLIPFAAALAYALKIKPVRKKLSI